MVENLTGALKTENRKMKDQLAGVEDAGPENAGPENGRTGKCRTMQDLEAGI